MTDIASLGIHVDASQATQAARSLDSLAQSASTTERGINSLGSTSTSAGRGVGTLVSSVTSAVGALSALAPVLGGIGFGLIAGDALKVNREMQSLRTSLETVTGSAAGATAAFKQIQAFAASTPYSVQQVTEAFIKLGNYGLKPSEAALTSYGNTASAMGKSLNQMIEAVADAATGEFERLKEFGIKSAKQGENVAFTFHGVTTTVKNSADDITNYLQKIGNTDFAGGMERQAQTIDGAISNLGDSWNQLLDNVITPAGERMIATMISGVASAVNSVATLDEKMVTFGNTTASVGDYVSATWGLIKSTAVNAISAINEQFPFIARGAQLAAVGASESLGAAWRIIKDLAVIAFNGIVGAINAMGVAIGTAAAGIVQVFAQNFDKVKAMAAGLASGIQSALAGDLSFKDLTTAYARETIGFKQVATDVNKGIKEALTFDYAGAIGGKIKDGAKQFHELQTAAAATNATLASGVKTAADHGEAHGNAATKTAKLTEAQKEAKKAGQEQQQLLESLRSPAEVFAADMEKITALYNIGAINLDKYNNALAVNIDKMTQAAASTDAAKRQQEQWNQLVKDANDLVDLKKSTSDAESLSVFAEQLRLAGLTTDEISKQLELQKAIDSAIKANPNQDPQIVRDLTAQRIAAEDTVKNAANKNTTEAKDFAAHAWEQAAKNIETSLANSIENALNGKGVASLQDFASSIKTTLFSAISNALSAGIIDAFKSQNWGDLLGGIITVGATILSGVFSKSATKTVSPSTTTAATYTGSGSFAIADTGARDYGYQFALDSAKQWNEGIKNALGGVKNVALSYLDELKSFGSQIIGSEFVTSVKNLFKPATDAISSGLKVVSDSLGNGASKLASSAKDLLGYVGALYSVYDYFSSLGDMIKRGNVVQILSNTGMMIGAVVALFNPLIGGLVTLGSFIVGLFSNIRTPNYWVNSFSPSNLQKADAASNVMGEDSIYTRTGNKSAFIGTNTAFGQFEISSHELSLTADEMRNQFGDIVKTVRNADNSLAASLNALDVKFGQAGQTMSLFAASLLRNRLATQQDASDLNIGSALDTRYAGISSKLAEGGTQAGAIASSWFNMLMGKLSEEAKKDNPGLSVGIAQFLGQALPALAEFPIELVSLVSQSISVLTKDHPGEDLVKQSLKVVEGFAKVKYGFETLGATATGSDIVKFLGALTSIGINAGDSAEQLVAYAAALKSTGQTLTDDFLGNLLNATKGLSKDQVGGYLSSFTLFASIAQGLNLKPTNTELDGLSNRLNNVASEASAAANEQIKQSIAANGLGNMSREAAVQQLILSGKLEKSTAEAAVFGTAIVNAQKPVVDAANFIAGVLAGTGANINTLGVSMGNIDGVAQTLITRFGDIKTAISETADFIQTVFGKQAYTQYANNQAVTTQGDILASHPEWAALGFKAGMDSAALEQVTKSWTGDMLASAIKVFATDPDAAAFKNAAKQLTQVISGNTGPITFDASFGKPAVIPPPAAIPDAEVPRYATGSGVTAVDTTQLQIRLAEALGEKQKALNLTREAEMRAVDSTSASILKEIYRAEDLNNARDTEKARLSQAERNAQDAADQQKRLEDQQKRLEDQQKQAAETAHQRQVAMANKQVELLNLQDFGLAATALSRQLEIDAMDESLRPMQRLKYMLEDQAKAADLLTQALDNYKSAAKDAASFLNDFRKSISSWIDGKKATSIGSPETQLGSAQSSAIAQYQKALSGDKSALGSITTYADNYLSAIDKYYGGNAKGEELKAQIIEAMKALPDQLTPEQIMEDGFKKTVDALNDLPSKIAALQSRLTNDIAEMVMHIDISANMPQELKDLAKTVGGELLVTVNAIAGSKLPDPIRLLAMGIENSIAADLNLLAHATLDPVLITMGLNTARVLNKEVEFYVTTPNLSLDVINLGLNSTEVLRRYANMVISADASTEVKALGLNVLGVAQKYAHMIINSELDTPTKMLKLAEADAFVKQVGLSLATTGHLTPDQEKVINSLGYGNISATQTLNQNVITSGDQLGINIASGALTNPNATVSVNSTLAWDVGTVNKTFQSIIDNTFNTASILGQWLPAIHDGTHFTKEHTQWTANNVVAMTEALVRRSYGLDGVPKSPYRTFAKGGYYPGGMALVGEEGPELINFRNPGQVYTAPQTQQIMAGDNKETVEMLKKQIEILNANIQVMQEGFRQLVAQGKKQNESLDNIERDTRRAVSA